MLITLSRRTAICQSVAEVQLTGVAPLGSVSHRSRIMNLPLMKFSLLPCGLRHTLFLNFFLQALTHYQVFFNDLHFYNSFELGTRRFNIPITTVI